MAGSMGGGGRGKKGFQNNLNLVPFIDLFSTMIIFLLSTAVWDQLAALETQLGAGEASASSTKVPEEVKKVKSDLRVTVGQRTFELFNSGSVRRIPIEADGTFDVNAVADFFAGARNANPDKRDLVVKASDLAKYENIIWIMDQASARDFDEVVLVGETAKWE